MGREALDAAAGIVATRAALAAAAIAVIVFLPAFLAALLDQLGRASRTASALRRMCPPVVQRLAAVAISVCIAAAFSGRPTPSGADTGADSVSEWLRTSATTAPRNAAIPQDRSAGTWYPDPGDPAAAGDQPETGTSAGEFPPTTTIEVLPEPVSTTTTPRPPRPTRSSRLLTTTTSKPASLRPTTDLVTPQASGSGSAVAPTPPIAPAEYIVVPGDCLWTIAAHRLPATATAADVDREWRRIYEANRAVVGPDPGLIRPGQRLAFPPLSNP